MKNFIKKNRDLWNNWTNKHIKSDFYSLNKFEKFKSSLKPIEIAELGDVKNKELLHLQCHFGLDTLSWANKKAITTGVDFSNKSIKQAYLLSKKYQIPSEFICADVLNLKNKITKKFDIIYTSYGVLEWLSNLNKWAETISFFLKPGGTFYIVEFHPLINMFDDNGNELSNPYFFRNNPIVFEEKGSYAEKNDKENLISYTWSHSIGEIITSLITANIHIEYFHEFSYSSYNCYSFLKKINDDKYILKKNIDIPLMFSIKGFKK